MILDSGVGDTSVPNVYQWHCLRIRIRQAIALAAIVFLVGRQDHAGE